MSKLEGALIGPALGLVLVLGMFPPERGSSAPERVAVPSIDETLRALGMTAEDRKAMLAGEIIVRDQKRIGHNEVVSGAAMMLPMRLEDMIESFGRWKPHERGQYTLANGRIQTPLREADWSEVRFDPSEQEAIAQVSRAAPGLELNLSPSEIASLNRQLAGTDLGSPDAARRASDAYRAILMERARDYLARGLDGVAPYDRGNGTLTSPADDLRLIWEVENDFLIDRFPAFVRAVGQYPRGQSPDVHNDFFWAKEAFRGEPAFVLEHRTWQAGDGFLLASWRFYFVGHTFDSQQSIALLLPDGDATALFYFNSTSSDLVTRYVRRIALPIGQRIMRGELAKMLDFYRNAPLDWVE